MSKLRYALPFGMPYPLSNIHRRYIHLPPLPPHTRRCCRGYTQKKIDENISAEIMQVVAEEARGSYAEEIVHELPSNSPDDLAAAEERVAAWLAAWKEEHP